MEGAFFVSLASSAAFQSRYAERFGNDVQVTFAGNAYDFGIMLHKAQTSSGARPLKYYPGLGRVF
jgi:hypothetical protein